VGLVIVGALSKDLDDAQDQVLRPPTGVGTDLSVSRPIAHRVVDVLGRGHFPSAPVRRGLGPPRAPLV
jgi:hypothetical protein